MQPPLRVVVLLNAAAGTLQAQGGTALADAVAAAFRLHRITAILETLHGPELDTAAKRAAQQAHNREIDAVVVGGGDGSIRTVAQALAGSEVPLGILPLGTLNHFARDLGIPTAVDDAVALIAAGATRHIDVGEVNGEIFVNNSSLGLYPYLVLERERWRRHTGLARWSAMILAGLGALQRLRMRRFSIRTEGVVEPYRSSGVFIGNNEYSLETGAFGRRARLDGGRLCIYVGSAQGRVALIRLAFRAALGLIDAGRDLRAMKVSRAEILLQKDRLLVALDGEIRVLQPPLQYRSRPGALRVFGPSSGDDSGFDRHGLA
ncbi:diacylglycerol/lipid kinase family protein [Microvirga sp. M2]|uniref:diacylglycerol/lipid kinase family protein n=1 Tax=Microvirga sp. M2 TaxID=3073270 RepID=UPI0039C28512